MTEHFKKSASKRLKKMRQYLFIYVLLIPLLGYFTLFSYVPLVMGFIQSFQKSKLLGNVEWVGIANYKEVLADKTFLDSIINGGLIGLGTLIVTFVGGLVLSIGLNEVKNKWTKSAIQTTSYLPYLFSWSVVGGMWVYILSANGLLNSIRESMGLDSILFLSEANFARGIMIFSGAWKGIGYTAVLFLASIVSINENLFEAAQIDSASRERQIRKIILPELVPTMKTVLLLAVMGIFTNFEQVFVMGNPAIIDKIRTPLLYIFDNGITKFNVGIATSAAVLILILTMSVTFLIRKFLLKEESA